MCTLIDPEKRIVRTLIKPETKRKNMTYFNKKKLGSVITIYNTISVSVDYYTAIYFDKM